MIIADISDTIRWWRTRGVRLSEIAAQLGCRRSWRAVENRMLEWWIDRVNTGRMP
jgi:hypothetical protein